MVWVSVWRVKWRRVKAGDVVIFHSPTHPGEVLVKRVVAEEGEEVETKGYRTRRVLVPRSHCWVEGDNIRASRDSNLFGPVRALLVHTVASRVNITTHVGVSGVNIWSGNPHCVAPSPLETAGL